MRKDRALLLVFSCAIAARAPIWWNLSGAPQALSRPDTASYARPAESLASGQGFTAEGRPEASRTPGYPVFLAANKAIGSNKPWSIALAQIVLDAGTAALVSLAADVVAPGPAAWAFGLLYAFDPVAAAHAPLLLTETLFTFLLTLCVALLLRAGRRPGTLPWALSGLCLGAATMVRPISLYLWLPWSAALAWAGKDSIRRRALTFAAAAALMPAAWCVRNAALWGHFEFSTITGTNFLVWEGAAVQAGVDGTTLAAAREKLLDEFRRRHPEPLSDPFQESRLRRELAGEIMRAHPGQVLKLHAVSTVKMLLGPGLDLVGKAIDPLQPLPSEESLVYSVTGQGTFAVLKTRPQLWPALVVIGLILALSYALGSLGVWILWKTRRGLELCILAVPLTYLLALSGGGWSYYRFRIPLLPLWAILAAVPFGKKRR